MKRGEHPPRRVEKYQRREPVLREGFRISLLARVDAKIVLQVGQRAQLSEQCLDCDKHDHEKHAESHDHPAAFTQCTTATQERDDEHHASNDNENDWSKKKVFVSNEVFVMLIRGSYKGAHNDCKQSSHLKSCGKVISMDTLRLIL